MRAQQMHRNRQSQRRQTHERPENTDTIGEMELEALMLSNERHEFSEEVLRIKTDVLMEVEAEWTTYQSKSLSNQTKRNAAADDRLALDETYTILMNDIRMMDAAIEELSIDISFEKRQFTRSTNHIEDLHDIRLALNLISKDFHAFAVDALYPVIKYEQAAKSQG